MSYRERYDDVFKLALDVCEHEIIDGQLAANEDVFHHQIATGAMVAEVLDRNGFDPLIQRLGAIAGALHDAGKYHPTIQELMSESEGKAFTAIQRDIMQTHTAKGFASIMALQTPYAQEIEVAAFAALHHHDTFTPETYDAHAGLAGIAHLVQLCDVSHSRLLDKSRAYRVARDGGRLGADVVAKQIIDGFTSLPPTILGQQIDVVDAVHRWLSENTLE